MSNTQVIIDTAREYLGTKYVHQGRSKHGIDCIGLLVVICNKLQICDTSVDRMDYPPQGTGIEVEARLQNGGLLRKPKGCAPIAGDVLGFWIGRSTRVQHIGVMTTESRFIHTHQGVGCVVEHALAGAWLRRVGVVWSFPVGE
jgi:cell wall-associated NlpC family hydrolase